MLSTGTSLRLMIAREPKRVVSTMSRSREKRKTKNPDIEEKRNRKEKDNITYLLRSVGQH